MSGANRMPVLFVSHGAPTLALDEVAGADFRRIAAGLPAPTAILVVSAHWLTAPATIGTTSTRELLYDFHGFPAELQRVRYAAPAAAELANELLSELPGLRANPLRPWDHGVWVPLLHMYPDADVPVLQLSLPYSAPPARWFELGSALAPWRERGVLVLGSGGAVHNLGQLAWPGGPVPDWALAFEGWLSERLAAGADDELIRFRELAPAVRLAHPTDEHFAPLLVALGAAAARPGRAVSFPIRGFEFGSLSRLAVGWS
jgi:4,5-DOPA dioxygenase extradiol